MADSSTLRSRRCRAHARNDHTWCRHGPPAALPGAAALPAAGDAPADPRSALEALWHRLEAAHMAEPGNAVLGRELRMTPTALMGEDPDAGLDCG